MGNREAKRDEIRRLLNLFDFRMLLLFLLPFVVIVMVIFVDVIVVEDVTVHSQNIH